MRVQNYIATILFSILIFFSNTSGAWLIQEGFEGQTDATRCKTFWQNNARIEVSSSQAASGTKSCKFFVNKGQTLWGGGFVTPKQSPGDETWMRFRIFMPAGFDYRTGYSGGHLKFIRMDAHPNGGGGRYDWLWSDPFLEPHAYWQRVEGVSCTNNCFYRFGLKNNPTQGVWETWEVYVKWDLTAQDSGGMARTVMWKDGVKIGENTQSATMASGTAQVGDMRLFDHWNGGSPQAQHLYFDDLVVTNVTPGDTDSAGNPYIGIGNYVIGAPQPSPTVAPPLPPTNPVAN